MKEHSFDVLTILDNIDVVDIIQTTFDPECLGVFFDDKVAKLYFDYGAKNKIEVQLNRLIQNRSIDYLWDVLKSEDWHLTWQDNFQPIIIDNKLTIIPDWEDISTTKFSVKIKPGMAFGTGHHETTWLVLSQMIKYIKPGMTVLDLGTGSGILAIAAKKIGAIKVDAVENDLDCKPNFFENITLNNIIDGVNFFHSNVLDWRNLNYDFIIANINQKIIESLIPKFKSTNANIILSGVLAENSMIIEKLLQSINFKINENIIKNEWLCINTIKS